MPHSAEEILAMLDLETIDETTYVGGHQGSTRLAKVYGGQLFAQALVAASRTVASDRPVNSLQGHFLAAGSHDAPVRYQVESVRDGRSFSSRSVRAYQGDRQVLHLAASFHVPEEGLAHQSEMPAAPPPEDLPPLHEVMARVSTLPHEDWRHEWAGLDVRYVPDNLIDAAGRIPAVQQMWVKTRDQLPEDPAVHRQVLAYLSDHTLLAASLVPHGFMLGDPELPRATLNHSLWFHDDARADEWLLVDQRSPWAGGARGVSFASIHTADGRRIASMAQEGLIRPQGELRRRLLVP
jgi:acyl-CoA thioesterase II